MKAKPLFLAVLVIFAIVLIVQNTETVDTRLLFATVSMPRALLLLITLGIGFAIGLLAGGRMRRKTAEPKAD